MSVEDWGTGVTNRILSVFKCARQGAVALADKTEPVLSMG